MRLKNYLHEKYLHSLKSRWGSDKKEMYSIYENPTITEIKFALEESRFNELRFICDDLNKKVFVWAADLIHCEVWDAFLVKKYGKGRNKDFSECMGLLPGNAVLKGGKLEMTFSDELGYQEPADSEWVDNILAINWKWAEKWVKIDKRMKIYRSAILE